MSIFTPEELAELAAFDKAMESEFDGCTSEEFARSKALDKAANEASMSAAEVKRKRCKAARDHEYYLRNKVRIIETYRTYYRNNREKCVACRRAYREAHREELREKKRLYYAAHREEILAKRKAEREAKRKAACETGTPTSGKGN